MKTYILLILFLACLSSCCSNDKSSLFFVIQPFQCKDSADCEPVFYGNNHFILYNDTTIYYFQRYPNSHLICGTGMDFSKPRYLYLAPDSLHIIPIKDLSHFLKKTIALERTGKIVCISSPNDTVRGLALWNIRKYCIQDTNIIVNIRKSTEEETFVSQAKFERKAYNPKKIRWEIGFSDGILEQKVLRFIPPQ